MTEITAKGSFIGYTSSMNGGKQHGSHSITGSTIHGKQAITEILI